MKVTSFKQYFNEVKFKFIHDAEKGKKRNEVLKGGKADGMTLEDIHREIHPDIPFNDLLKEFQKGLKIEMEHTSDKKIAAEIARDHIAEFWDYYTRLSKMEKEAE